MGVDVTGAGGCGWQEASAMATTVILGVIMSLGRQPRRQFGSGNFARRPRKDNFGHARSETASREK